MSIEELCVFLNKHMEMPNNLQNSSEQSILSYLKMDTCTDIKINHNLRTTVKKGTSALMARRMNKKANRFTCRILKISSDFIEKKEN